jgi:adenine/guanine phosphoribosyltransferase-like PRPP-binding protein/thymidylate kinase
MRAPPQTRLIELFSVPGAGKSTLVDALSTQSALRTRESLSATWQALPRASKAAVVAAAFLDPRVSGAAIATAFSQRLSSRESLVRLAKLVAKSRWMASQRGEFILDQGLLQDLWSIHYASGRFDPDPKALSPLLRQLYRGLDAQILFIDVDQQTAAKRIRSRSRGDSRLDGLPEAQMNASLANGARVPEAILKAARDAALPVTVIDGEAPLDNVLERVRPLLPNGKNAGHAPQGKTIVTLDQAADLARELAAAIPADQFDLVVGIANGGVHPAYYVAEALGLPLQIVRVERDSTRLKKRMGFARKALKIPGLQKPLRRINRYVDRRLTGVRSNLAAPDAVRGKRVLLVDDCIDSGASVALARSLIEKEGAAGIKIAVLCWSTKYDSAQMHGVTPDYVLGRKLPSYPWSADNPDYARFKVWLRSWAGP